MQHSDFFIEINTTVQTLNVWSKQSSLFKSYVSTAKNGVGEQRDSGCTPRGWLQIKAKIGADCPENTVFVARRPTGEIYTAELAAQYPERDWILTRILWLGGLEPHRNRYGVVDTLRRFIYIHGSPDHYPTGVANSHGCIRMRNADIIELFNIVRVGTQIYVV